MNIEQGHELKCLFYQQGILFNMTIKYVFKLAVKTNKKATKVKVIYVVQKRNKNIPLNIMEDWLEIYKIILKYIKSYVHS